MDFSSFSNIYNILKKVLLFSWLKARIPTIEEIQEELSKKPGRAKIYYLNAVIPQVKVALRKLERAVLITGIMFLTDIGGDGQEFITNAIYELVFTEATVTLHTFTVICSIIISISEGQFKWGKAKLNPVLNDRICNQLWTFLSSIRQKNPDQLEAYSHLGRLFTRAFKVIKKNKTNNPIIVFLKSKWEMVETSSRASIGRTLMKTLQKRFRMRRKMAFACVKKERKEASRVA